MESTKNISTHFTLLVAIAVICILAVIVVRFV